MDVMFEDAVRENVRLRMALIGPSGAGKTSGALEVATNLFGGELNVFGADTEHGRMRLYADRYKFKHAEMVDDFSPESFIRVIDSAERAGADILVIDSMSHEWMGKGGVLQLADRFGDWKQIRPRHTEFIERMLASQLHIICCIRSKMKYEVSTEARPGGDGERQRIEKLGLGPVQDDAIIYEFDVVGDIDAQTHLTTFTNRCDPLVDTTRSLHPGKEVADILTEWMSEGRPPEPPPAATDEAVTELVAMLTELDYTAEKIESGLAIARSANRGQLHPDYVSEQAAKLRPKVNRKREAAERQAQADADRVLRERQEAEQEAHRVMTQESGA